MWPDILQASCRFIGNIPIFHETILFKIFTGNIIKTVWNDLTKMKTIVQKNKYLKANWDILLFVCTVEHGMHFFTNTNFTWKSYMKINFTVSARQCWIFIAANLYFPTRGTMKLFTIKFIYPVEQATYIYDRADPMHQNNTWLYFSMYISIVATRRNSISRQFPSPPLPWRKPSINVVSSRRDEGKKNESFKAIAPFSEKKSRSYSTLLHLAVKQNVFRWISTRNE